MKRDFRRGGNRRSQPHDFPACPLCGKPVRYLMTAIAQGEGATPAHFDCVLRDIAQHEELQPKEKVCYLGNGDFGILKFQQGGPVRFTIRKRIQYEATDKDITWRKRISNRGKTRTGEKPAN